jgi:hypothetical protein
MRQVGKGARKPLLPTPSKRFGAQDKAAVGWPFLWLLSFGHAKESNSPVGARTDIQIASQGETFYKQLNTQSMPITSAINFKLTLSKPIQQIVFNVFDIFQTNRNSHQTIFNSGFCS